MKPLRFRIKTKCISVNNSHIHMASGGRVCKFPSRETKAYQSAIQKKFKERYPEHTPVECKVQVRMRFRIARETRRDVDNLIKIPLDALNGLAWKDDSLVYKLTVEKLPSKDKEDSVMFVIKKFE